MAQPWFRLYAEFATDPKVQFLSETLQRRYIMFLCVSCNGDIEKLSDDELAFAFRISLDDYLETKALFIQKGLLDKDGRVANWKKRQYLSDDSTERVRKHRERKRKRNVTLHETLRNGSVTPPDTDTDTDTDNKKHTVKQVDHVYFGLSSITDQDRKDWKALFPDVNIHAVLKKAVAYREKYPDRSDEDLKIRDWLVKALQKDQDKATKEKIVESWFEKIWERYPRKQKRKEAFRHFRATVQSESDLNDIYQALRNYQQHLTNEGTEARFIQAGSTWFNNWRDWVEWTPPENAVTEAAPVKKFTQLYEEGVIR